MRTSADFGYRVHEERERQGITQAELAGRADVSVWLSNFERGKSPRAELIKVVHVVRALGLVFALDEDPSPQLSEAQQRLVKSVRDSLPPSTVLPPLATTLGPQTAKQLENVDFSRLQDSARRMAAMVNSLESPNLDASSTAGRNR